MGFWRTTVKIVVGAAAGVGTVMALPIFGAVGTVTAIGAAVGAGIGAAAGAVSAVDNKKSDRSTTTPGPPTVLEFNLKRLSNELDAHSSKPRIAIMGQAGAGKSTLLVTATDNQVRPTPIIGIGTDATTWAEDRSTNLLHWWKVAAIVDVPGYGTPSHPTTIMVENFPADRISHALFIIREKIRADDIEMHRLLIKHHVPCRIVRSYATDLSSSEREKVEADIQSHLDLQTTDPIHFIDNRTGLGIGDISCLVSTWIGFT